MRVFGGSPEGTETIGFSYTPKSVGSGQGRHIAPKKARHLPLKVTAAFLAKARKQTDCAGTMLNVALNKDAGRAAYLTGLHAAQALLFEMPGRVFKRQEAGRDRRPDRAPRPLSRVPAGRGG